MTTAQMRLPILLFLITICESAKILMIMPMYTKSHNTLFELAANVLADSGHKITLATPYPVARPHPNIEQYRVGDPSKLDENEEHQYFDGRKEHPIEFFYSFTGFFVDSCEDFYKQPQVKSIIDHIKKDKGVKLYDVAIVEMLPTECALPFASLVANHTAMMSVIPVPFWNGVDLRIPVPTSTTPMIYMSDVGPPTTFCERFMNTFNCYVVYFLWKFRILPRMQDIAEKYLPPWAPSVSEAHNSVNLIMVNTDTISAVPRATMPFVVQIGGLHLQEPKPLPQDIENFIQSSGKEGVILLTFGSFLNTREMPIKLRNAFVEAFRKLKQKVIWKFHEQIEGAPKNLMIRPWLPQKEILAHPKVILFITHGGILSSQELLYFAKPIVGIPVFADQQQNIDILIKFGMGEALRLQEVTAESLYQIINNVLNNQKYAERAKEASSIIRDRRDTSSESVVYWIEYLIRYNGAPHLKIKEAEDLYLFQYLLLDVVGLMLIAIILVMAAIIAIFKLLARLLFKTTKEETTKKNN